MMNALRITIFTLIVMAAGLLTSNNAEALLETHQCTFCHSLHGSSSTSSFVPQNSPTNIEVLCLGCHLTANGATAAVQPHRTGEGDAAAGFTGNYYVTCRDCHNIHDNMPNWRQGHSDAADGNDGSPPPAGWVEGTNAKMVGREDPDGVTPYAIIQTREADFDKNGIPDRDASVTVTCDELVQNDCYVRGKRHVIFENIDGSAAGASIHGFADDNEDGVDDTTAIGDASNISDSGFDMSPWDSVCQMCHSMTANHSLPTNKGTTHNSSRRCTDCHEHGFCFDRGNSCSKWTVPNRDVSVDLVAASPNLINPGQTTTITADVTNSGDNIETFRVKYASDISGIVGWSTVTDLAPTGSTQTSFDWTATAGGTHTVSASAEILIGELNIADNTSTDILTVIVVHDVAVISVSAPDPVGSGETVTVNVDISNSGNFTETFDVTLVSDLDGTIGTLSSGALAEAGSTTLDFSWDTTSSTPGSHTLTATAIHDGADGGTDANAGNNSANTTATVAVHDVAITTITTPVTTEQGNIASIDVDIINNSGTGGFTETFNVTLYDNTDDPGHASPIQILSSGALAAGGSDTLNFSWDTTSASINLHTLEAVADTVSGEIITANNTDTSTADVIVPLIHDVAVDLVTAPALVAQGDSPTVSVDISNSGQATETFNVTLSSDLDGSIQVLSSGPLPAAGSTTLNFTWVTTSSTLGLHTLTATADTVAGESLTGDNDASTTSTVAVHDVAITNVTSPAAVTIGTIAAVDVDIANEGGFAETFNVTLSSNLDGVIDTLPSGALAASGTDTLNFSWDTSAATAGTHTLTLTADTVAGETDTADNIDATATTEVTSHDVAITNITAPPSTDQGNVAPVDVDITNEGTFSETFNVTLYDNTDDPGHGSPIQVLSSGALGAGSSTQLNFSWDTSSASVATHTLEAVADTVAGETDTADNTDTTTADVILPVLHDVAVDLVTAPATAVQGTSPTVAVDISNNGGAAESFNVTLSSTLDGVIQVLPSGVLGISGSTTLNFTWDTSSASLGLHTLTAVADTVTDETLTADNTKNTTSTVVIHDVSVTNVTATATVEKGNTDSVSVDIANPGDFAETFNVTLVSDLDGTIDTVSSGAISAGGSTTINIDWDTTSSTLGLHTLTATAVHNGGDGGTDAVPGNDASNTTATVAVHDVSVVSIDPVASTSQGSAAAVDVNISNLGGFAENIDVTLTSDLNGSIQTINTGSLASSSSTTLNFNWDTTGFDIDTHTLTATWTHASDGGSDINSGNNAANTTGLVTVASYANDLAIVSITDNKGGPVINTCGSMMNPIVLTVSVKNEGTVAQPSVAVDINSDNGDDPGPPIQQLGAINPGATNSVNFNWLFAGNDDCGTRTWTAIVDAVDSIGDEDLSDNTMDYVVIIPGEHDVMISSVTAASTVSVGNVETVSVEVFNGHDSTETFDVTLASDQDGTIQTLSSGALAAGASTILNFSWTPVNTGSHTLTASTSHDGGDGGSDVNTNNDSAQTTTTASAVASNHDVAITNVAAPASTEQGNVASVDVDISNPGDFTETFNVTLSSDLDGTIQILSSGALAALGSDTLNFSWDTTGATTGTHTLTATADTVSGETSTSDNTDTASSDVTAPVIHDVAVDLVSVAATVDEGTSPTVSVDISNNGGATETFNVTLTSDLDGVIQILSSGALAPGSDTLNFTWNTTGATLGLHTLTATADTVVGEVLTADNTDTATSTVVTHDVAVTLVTAPATVALGGVASVDVDIANQGDYTETFNVTLSSDLDGVIDVLSSGALLASGTDTLNFSWNTTGASTGTHVLTATADTVAGETDTADNADTANSDVTSHDVAITLVTMPASTDQGITAAVDVDIANEGTFTETFNVTLYDNTDDPGHGTPIQILSSGALGAGGSDTLNFSWDTSSASIATHTLEAVAETVAGETDTADNTGTDTGNVIAPVTHDVAVDLVTVAANIEKGTSPTVSVDISNNGGAVETFNVTLTSDLDGTIQVLSSGALAPGSTTLNFTWNTSSATLGLHTLTATADTVIGEVLTADNTDTATSTVELHDVAVTNVTATAIVLQGATDTVDVDISNPGSITETFNVTLVSDLDGTIGTLSSGALAGGASTTLNFSWDTTLSTLGLHTLTATAAHGADGGTDANSGNDAANTTATVAVHDVAVTLVTAPASTSEGGIAAVDVDISNPGGFTENIDVTLVSDLDGPIQTINTGTLAALGSTTLNFSWDTTGASIAVHTLTATWTHDGSDGGTDANAGNDAANTTSEVTSGGGGTNDLAITSITFTPPSPGTFCGSNQQVAITARITNEGTGLEPNAAVRLDSDNGDDPSFSAKQTGDLAPGAFVDVNWTWTWGRRDACGIRTFTIDVDIVPGETDTADNVLVVPYDVQ